jgi:DNA-binding transcriptional ArsR family regulator
MTKRTTDRISAIRCDAYNDDPLRVARVEHSLPPKQELERTAELLKGLAHPVRVAIAAALLVEPLCVCELSVLLGMSAPALMHHLKAMAGAGVLDVRKVGKFAEYYLADGRVKAILDATRKKSAPIGGPCS